MTRARQGFRPWFLVVAMAIVLGGLLLAPEPPPPWRFALAVAAMVAAQQLVLHLRVGAAVLTLLWGEAALVVTLVLVPAGWVPLALAAGTLLGITLRRLRGPSHQVTLSGSLCTAASLGVAGAIAAAIAFAWADPYATDLTPRTAAGLVLAALAYLLAATVLASVANAVRYQASVARLLRRALRSKALMFVGNLTLGLTVIALAEADWRWLLGLPVAVWLLHRTYAHRLRVSERRRMWGAFAQATRSLNRADDAAVALAGVRGAVEVFAVGRVEVELGEPDGVRHTWIGDHQTGEVHQVSVPADPVSPPAPPLPRYLAPATTVPLLVGAGEVGRLRVHFPTLVGPGHGEEAALQAYGDALAAAVHDAATHQELHRMLASSASDAQHDPLTGLYNRAALVTRGETAVQLAPRGGRLTLWLVDVDHFREINDTLGHAAGDEVLRVTGQRLQALARPGELLARLGGDEFALLATGPTVAAGGDDRPLRRGRELAARLAEEADIGGLPVSIDVSVGVVVAPAGTADLTELLRRADTAMRQARQGHREPVGWYEATGDPGSSDRPALLADLRAALARDDELVLVFQPVVDLATGAPTELEALVRWQHPQRGLLPPSEFVRVVENSDLLERFTEYIVDKALGIAAQQARRGPAIPVAVNLSARSLLDPRLPKAVNALLRKHRVPGRRLVLEITETVVASELPGIEEALARLRGLGVRLAVDDFGTGHASLAFLARVPLDAVKVDRAFVAEMDTSAPAEAIVRATVELGRELGLRVVAEGVQTADQRRRLTKLGCTAAQGFSIAEPIPAHLLGEALTGLAATAAPTPAPGRRPSTSPQGVGFVQDRSVTRP